VNIYNKNRGKAWIKSNDVNSSKMLNTNVDIQVNFKRQLMNLNVLEQPSLELDDNRTAFQRS
jgi:ribosomal 50S subunit-recycling heat shock protein